MGGMEQHEWLQAAAGLAMLLLRWGVEMWAYALLGGLAAYLATHVVWRMRRASVREGV